MSTLSTSLPCPAVAPNFCTNFEVEPSGLPVGCAADVVLLTVAAAPGAVVPVVAGAVVATALLAAVVGAVVAAALAAGFVAVAAPAVAVGAVVAGTGVFVALLLPQAARIAAAALPAIPPINVRRVNRLPKSVLSDMRSSPFATGRTDVSPHTRGYCLSFDP
jgi:hypothetical protein